jgi:hypothetical protein
MPSSGGVYHHNITGHTLYLTEHETHNLQDEIHNRSTQRLYAWRCTIFLKTTVIFFVLLISVLMISTVKQNQRTHNIMVYLFNLSL